MDPMFDTVRNFNRKRRSLGRTAFESPDSANGTATSTKEVKPAPKEAAAKTTAEPVVKLHGPVTNNVIDLMTEDLLKKAADKPDSEYIETDPGRYGSLNVTPEYLSKLAEAYRQKEIGNIKDGAEKIKALNNSANSLQNKLDAIDDILPPYKKTPKNFEALPGAIEEKIKTFESLFQ